MHRAFNLPGLMNLHKTSRLVPLAAENKNKKTKIRLDLRLGPMFLIKIPDALKASEVNFEFCVGCMHTVCCISLLFHTLCIRVVREVPCKRGDDRMLRWMVLELILTNAWDHWRD